MRLFILFFGLLASSLTLADRIKDLTTVAGVRSNPTDWIRFGCRVECDR